MKRRSFLAESAAASCVALMKTEASWGKAPNPFTKIEFYPDDVKYQVVYVFNNDLKSSEVIRFEIDRINSCKIYHDKIMNEIPLSEKEQDKSKFYAEITKQYRGYNIEFYEIYNHTRSGDKVTTYSNLYAVGREHLPR